MLQRSGGLENSKFLYQTRLLSPSINIELIIYRHNDLMVYILRKHKDIFSSLSDLQSSNKPSNKYSSRRGNLHSTQCNLWAILQRNIQRNPEENSAQ